MRKQVVCTLLLALLFTMSSPYVASAAMHATTAAIAKENTTESELATRLLHRLDEIKAMNKSDLSRAERKALRQEVRDIKKELRAVSGGVYLSTGAIIIIVLLLILLL